MKKISLLLIAMIFATGISQALASKRYLGTAKIPGQVIDLMVELKISEDPENNRLTIGPEGYDGVNIVETDSNGKKIYTVKREGKEDVVFTSTDGGSTIEGTVNFNGKNLQAWLMEIPKGECDYYKTDEDLLKAIESDSYNAYLQFYINGSWMAAMGEFIFNPQTKTFSVKFDNSAVQSVFGKMKGKYGITQFTNNSGELSRKVYIVDASGKRLECSPRGKDADMEFNLGAAGPIKSAWLHLIR